MQKVNSNKTSDFVLNYGISFKKLFILTSMLLKDKMKISFKANKKQSLVKIISLAILFIVLCAVSNVFYQVAVMLNIFSVLKYIPLTVPSLIMSFLLIFGFFSLLINLTKALYLSKDNQIMITYPCNGSTIFFARLLVYFINEYIRNITIQIPLLIGYMIVMNAPVVMYFYIFVAFIFITLFEVLLASLFSIPTYYIMMFLKRFSLLKTILYVIFYITIISLGVYVVLLIPENIDIFTNWGPYFNSIQAFLKGFSDYFAGLYYLSMFTLGKLDGFSYLIFSFEGLYTFIFLILAILLFFTLALFIINPIYFKLTSSGFEVESKESNRIKVNKKHNFYISQIKKELLLFKDGDSIILSILASFITLPIIILLISKVFGAMGVNTRGFMYSQVIVLAIILLIALNTNTIIATAYSKEGEAFKLNKTYPNKGYFMLTSKLIIPMIIGSLSILVSSIIFNNFFLNDITSSVFLTLGVILLYIGHMLYSAQVDFSSISSLFNNTGTTSKATRNSTFLAFLLSIVICLLFYLFLTNSGQQPLFAHYIKLFIIGLIYISSSIWIYYYKIKLIYKEGD